jgi:type I restriction enzyme S subunit
MLSPATPHGLSSPGSRSTRRARRYSDLDLAIDAGRPLTLDELARLAEAFRESDLPYRVDIVDWRSIDDRFRQVIAAERVQLDETASADTDALRSNDPKIV